MPDYSYIQDQSELDRLKDRIFSSTYLAIDTESSGFHTYYSELCLVQISSEGGHFILDPLAGLNLECLADALANEDITKIFHSAASDIAEFKRESGWDCKNVFDTLVACRMLSQEGCSLAAVVERYLGIHLEKREQKSNWKKRPLTDSQLLYAHLDTKFLPEIMNKMSEQLIERGLFDEYQSETEFIARTVTVHEKRDQENAWKKVNGVRQVKPIERGRFRVLYQIRENRARIENIAPFRIMSNDTMFQIAEYMPDSHEELRSFGIHPAIYTKDADAILEGIRSAEPVTNQDLKSDHVRDPQKEELQARLKAWRNGIAEQRSIDASLILSNRSIKDIVDSMPASLKALADLDVMSQWKLDNYGQDILDLLKS